MPSSRAVTPHADAIPVAHKDAYMSQGFQIVELSRILQSIAPRVPKVNSHISFKVSVVVTFAADARTLERTQQG